jgi:hypothetical protein
MEDPANMHHSTKSTYEKYSFEDSALTPTWFTSAANVTRKISDKLLAWGVEERGAYHIVIFEHCQSLIRQRPAGYRRGPWYVFRVLLDRHPPRRRR